jgi:hypothetical protein
MRIIQKLKRPTAFWKYQNSAAVNIQNVVYKFRIGPGLVQIQYGGRYCSKDRTKTFEVIFKI